MLEITPRAFRRLSWIAVLTLIALREESINSLIFKK